MTALIVRSPLHCSRFKTSLFFLFFSGEARLQKPPRVKKSPFLQIRRYSHRKYQVFLSTEWRLFTEYSKDYPLSQQSQHSTPKSLDIRAILIILVFRLDSILFGNGQCPWLQCVGQVQMAEMKENLKKHKKDSIALKSFSCYSVQCTVFPPELAVWVCLGIFANGRVSPDLYNIPHI